MSTEGKSTVQEIIEFYNLTQQDPTDLSHNDRMQLKTLNKKFLGVDLLGTVLHAYAQLGDKYCKLQIEFDKLVEKKLDEQH